MTENTQEIDLNSVLKKLNSLIEETRQIRIDEAVQFMECAGVVLQEKIDAHRKTARRRVNKT